MTPEQLKASILQYAMEGKLVKQDPNDEPASDTVKTKSMEESRTEPYKIPVNWKWIRLGSGVRFINGRAYKKSELLTDSNLTPVLRVGNLFTNSSWYYSDLKLDKDKYIDNGDLIYAWSASFGPRIWNGEHVIYHYHIWKTVINEGIDKKFLYYFLSDPHKVLGETKLHGSTMKHVTKTNMEKLPFPLPPLEEQKRIVAKIEKIMPLVDEYAESYNRLQKIDNEFEDKLKQSVLQYAMEGKLVKQNPNDEPASELIKKIENEKNELVKEGKISKLRKASPISDEEKAFRIPNNWKWVRLEEIAQLNTGTTPSIGKSRYEGNYIPFIKPGDISSKGINYNNFGLSKDGLRHGRLIDENSLLTVCIGGSTGKTYYTDRAISCNQQINASTPYKGVSVMFLFYEMLSNHFQEEIHQHASGSATPIINKTKFGNLCLPLPPLEEQKRIVAKIEKIMNSINNH